MRKLNLLIAVPPALILVVGAATYITVVKLSTPEPIIVRGTPQATLSASDSAQAQSSDITTTVVPPTKEQIEQWQRKASDGGEQWRFDPLSAAKHMSLNYGFETADPFQLIDGSGQRPQVTARHKNQIYTLVMKQADNSATKKVWYISEIKTE